MGAITFSYLTSFEHAQNTEVILTKPMKFLFRQKNQAWLQENSEELSFQTASRVGRWGATIEKTFSAGCYNMVLF